MQCLKCIGYLIRASHGQIVNQSSTYEIFFALLGSWHTWDNIGFDLQRVMHWNWVAAQMFHLQTLWLPSSAPLPPPPGSCGCSQLHGIHPCPLQHPFPKHWSGSRQCNGPPWGPVSSSETCSLLLQVTHPGAPVYSKIPSLCFGVDYHVLGHSWQSCCIILHGSNVLHCNDTMHLCNLKELETTLFSMYLYYRTLRIGSHRQKCLVLLVIKEATQ